jgi:hypothetical protein
MDKTVDGNFFLEVHEEMVACLIKMVLPYALYHGACTMSISLSNNSYTETEMEQGLVIIIIFRLD